jgi:hypothetical protein
MQPHVWAPCPVEQVCDRNGKYLRPLNTSGAVRNAASAGKRTDPATKRIMREKLHLKIQDAGLVRPPIQKAKKVKKKRGQQKA